METVSPKPALFQLEAFQNLRAKSLENTSFFEKFGYSNIFLPVETTNWLAKPNGISNQEEEMEDNSTNAPESRTISLRSENDIGAGQNENEKPKKKTIKLRSVIEKMLVQDSTDPEFLTRFATVEKNDEGTEVWEF